MSEFKGSEDGSLKVLVLNLTTHRPLEYETFGEEVESFLCRNTSSILPASGAYRITRIIHHTKEANWDRRWPLHLFATSVNLLSREAKGNWLKSNSSCPIQWAMQRVEQKPQLKAMGLHIDSSQYLPQLTA